MKALHTIPRRPVDSTAVKSIGYDPVHRTLAVEFAAGGVYHYEDVSNAEHEALTRADSLGRHLSKFITTKKKCRRIL